MTGFKQKEENTKKNKKKTQQLLTNLKINKNKKENIIHSISLFVEDIVNVN